MDFLSYLPGLSPNSLLLVGVLVITGFVAGEAAQLAKLPRASGYLLAGILLNPGLTHLVPASFAEHTGTVIDISLALITFAIGGSIRFRELRRTGRSILAIGVLQAELTLLITAVGMAALFSFTPWFGGEIVRFALPAAILLGGLALPTDPAALLAVKKQYGAKGRVSSTIMSTAAIDDMLTFVNFAFAIQFAMAFAPGSQAHFSQALWEATYSIGGAVLAGILFGWLFNSFCRLMKNEGEGFLIILLLGMLFTTFGLAKMLNIDEMLATMVMGMLIINFNPKHKAIFSILERYTEELVFILFFTISAMQMDFGALGQSMAIVLPFVLLRAIGKHTGVWTGAVSTGAPRKVRKWATLGLLPQGGIVIGLALTIKEHAAFSPVADLIINTVIAATIINEISGPVLAKLSLKKAGEIR
jgi:Kef-type K+ transport system membrane component KefB